MPSSFARYVLNDWPEDRLPVCSAPTCDREIKNGDPYAILDGTIKLLCLSCALDPCIREETLARMAVDAVRREREAKERRVTQHRTQQQRSKKITQKSRTVVTRPQNPREHPPRSSQPSPFLYPPHPCRFCATVFQPRAVKILVDGRRVQGPQPYCSVSCSTQGRAYTGSKMICPACDQVFSPKRGTSEVPQVCCSRSCARWWFPRRLRNPNPTPLRWSSAWGDGCRACGRSDRRHRGQGYCPGCYRRLRVPGQGRAEEGRLPDRTWRVRMERKSYVAAQQQTQQRVSSTANSL